MSHGGRRVVVDIVSGVVAGGMCDGTAGTLRGHARDVRRLLRFAHAVRIPPGRPDSRCVGRPDLFGAAAPGVARRARLPGRLRVQRGPLPVRVPADRVHDSAPVRGPVRRAGRMDHAGPRDPGDRRPGRHRLARHEGATGRAARPGPRAGRGLARGARPSAARRAAAPPAPSEHPLHAVRPGPPRRRAGGWRPLRRGGTGQPAGPLSAPFAAHGRAGVGLLPRWRLLRRQEERRGARSCSESRAGVG